MVVTVTDAFSLLGYCRTFRLRNAWSPAIRITRLTTTARTGRRMKRSVKFTELGLGLPARSGVARLGRELGVRDEGIVDVDRASRPQAEHAGGDDGVPFLQAREDRHEVAAPDAEAHDLLADNLLLLAGRRVRLLVDNVDGVAEGGVEDGGRRDGEDIVDLGQLDLDVHVHPGVQEARG